MELYAEHDGPVRPDTEVSFVCNLSDPDVATTAVLRWRYNMLNAVVSTCHSWKYDICFFPCNYYCHFSNGWDYHHLPEQCSSQWEYESSNTTHRYDKRVHHMYKFSNLYLDWWTCGHTRKMICTFAQFAFVTFWCKKLIVYHASFFYRFFVTGSFKVRPRKLPCLHLDMTREVNHDMVIDSQLGFWTNFKLFLLYCCFCLFWALPMFPWARAQESEWFATSSVQ